MSTIAQVSDLQTFTGLNLDTDRAQLLLNLAEQLAQSVVNPLPLTAQAVILTAAARALPNPAQVASQSVAGASTAYGPAAGGLYLTRYERRDLRRLAGIGGGAFSVNAAVNAGKGYVDPLRPLTSEDTEQLMYDYDIPGRPA